MTESESAREPAADLGTEAMTDDLAGPRFRAKAARVGDLGLQSVRSETSQARDAAAAIRDRVARERDNAAVNRDRGWSELDAEMQRLERESDESGHEIQARLHEERLRAVASRTRAILQRQASAHDRDLAADDRRLAALDREHAARELADEGVDHLTGSLRRRAGLAAIQRELDRSLRNGEPLCVAYVDVVGLKHVNDTLGHAAGDELLREVAASIAHHLRSYDVVARFGGDEFVCSLSGQDAAGAGRRFRDIASSLAAGPSRAQITVGLAERRDGDALDELILRADSAMIGARRNRGLRERGPRIMP